MTNINIDPRPVLKSMEPTNKALDSGFNTYNEAGLTYNEAGYTYGGIYGVDGNAPVLKNADIIKPIFKI